MFTFEPDDDAHHLRIQLNQVAPLVLAHGIHSSGNIGAELKVSRQQLELVHREVGKEDHHVLLDANNEPRVVLVAASNDADVVAHRKVLLEFVSLEFQRIAKVFVLGHDGHFAPIDGDDPSAQVDQLSLAHLHGIAGSKVGGGFTFASDNADLDTRAL